MPSVADLQAALMRLLDGTAGGDDRTMVRDAIDSGATLATGERAVALGGSADGAVIATGDGNVVLKFDAAGAEAIEAVLRQVFPSRLRLPADLPDFEGRGDQVECLLAALRDEGGGAAITALGGMGGLGKTALAVHVGHLLADHFPDGRVLISLAGTSQSPLTAEAALSQVIRAFQPQAQLPESLEELQAIYAAVLEGKRVLLVFDDARDGSQVASLRPPTSCRMIVTSRQSLALPGLVALALDVMADAEAMALLKATAGIGRASDEEFSTIAGLCGYLPLALRVSGTFLRVNTLWSAAEYIAALKDERGRLARLVVEAHKDLDVGVSLTLSVTQLAKERPDLVERWRLLSVFPADFAMPAAAAVWEAELEVARDDLQRLLSRSLILHDHETKRFRLHDLMRDLAGGVTMVSPDERGDGLSSRLDAAKAQHAQYYVDVLKETNQHYFAGHEGIQRALALYDLERINIGASQIWIATRVKTSRQAAELGAQYCEAGVCVLPLRLTPGERVRWLQVALAAARQLGDRGGECAALGNLGGAYALLRERRRAIECHDLQLKISRELGDRRGESAALGNLGIIYDALGEPRRAIENHGKALEISREIGDRLSESNHLGNLGLAYFAPGDAKRAIELHEQRLQISREIGDQLGECGALGNLGIAYARDGDTPRAMDLFQKAKEISLRLGDKFGLGRALNELSKVYLSLGDTKQAIDCATQRLTIARELGDRLGEAYSLGCLGNAHRALGESQKAMNCHEKRLQIAHEIGERREQGHALGDLGTANLDLNHVPRAIELYHQYLQVARETGYRRGEAYAQALLGIAFKRLGNVPESIGHYEQAHVILDEIGDPRAEGVASTLDRLRQA